MLIISGQFLFVFSQAVVMDDLKLLNDPEAKDRVMHLLARKGYVFIAGKEFWLESDTQRILFHLHFLFWLELMLHF